MLRTAMGCIGTGLLLVAAGVLAATGSSSEFVGAATCGRCHPSAYEVWKRSSHSRAHQALPERQQKDPRCTQCHGIDDIKVAGVQCEICHGAGKHFARRNVMRDRELSRIVGLVEVNQETCRRCHNETTASILPFDWERMWEIFSHGRDTKNPAAPKP